MKDKFDLNGSKNNTRHAHKVFDVITLQATEILKPRLGKKKEDE